MKKSLPFYIKYLSLTTVLAVLFLLSPKLASASTLYLSPGSGSIAVGGTKSVQVRLSAGGDSVNGVSAFLSYPQDKVDVAWVTGGSAFAIEAEKSFGGGIIKISRGNISGVSGDVNVATIGLRGKAAGQATVAFIGGSQAPRASDSSDSLNLGGSRGGVYNVGGTVPQATKAPSQGTKSGGTSVSAVAQLLISELQIADVSSSSATINWKTNGQADSVVEYGLEKDQYFLAASDDTLVNDHSLKLENKFLVPGLRLHFRVRSKDNAGHEAVGDDQLLKFPGYRVVVKIVDDIGNPLAGVKVFLYSDPLEATTNSAGEATFENVTAGKHTVLAKFMGVEKSTELTVDSSKGVAGASTNTTMQMNLPPTAKIAQAISPIFVATPAVVLIIVGVVIVIIIKKRRKNQGGKQGGVPSSNTTNTSAADSTNKIMTENRGNTS